MLRLTVFRKFEVFGFVAGLVVKIPACAKPRPVMCHSKRQCYNEMTVNKNGQLSIGRPVFLSKFETTFN